jgi:MGT family glycosyltransferase
MPYRIVINCWGSFGDVYPYVGLAAELRERGTVPVIATAEIYRETVEQAGIEFAHVGPDLDALDSTLFERVMHPTRGSEVIVRELLMPKLDETYERLSAAAAGADMIVSHPITYAAPVVAERRKLPWVSTILAPMLFFSEYDLPVFPHHPLLVHAPKLGGFVARSMLSLIRKATASWTEPVQQLRERVGLARGAHPMLEGMLSPVRSLALFSRVLGSPQPDWPANVVTTGFVFYNGREPLDPKLEEFLAAGEPPVVFTLGTSAVGAAGRFYHESAAAVARLGLRAVLLTGGFAQNVPDEPLPPGVLVVDRAPHQLLFPRACAVVHQGGVGTTGQALRAGHPTIIVPHGHDQPDNAQRVAKLGVSRTIYPQRYRAKRVARELTRVLDDAYRRRAHQVSTIVTSEGGAEAAAAEIESLLL